MFMSQYNHTMDAKGRLSIPSKFREQLGDEFVITKGMDGCLFVFDNKNWAEFEEKLSALPMGKLETRQYTRFFLAGATQVEVDKQGRILIPASLREYAELEGDAHIIGMDTNLEIWNTELWAEENAKYSPESVAEIVEGLEF